MGWATLSTWIWCAPLLITWTSKKWSNFGNHFFDLLACTSKQNQIYFFFGKSPTFDRVLLFHNWWPQSVKINEFRITFASCQKCSKKLTREYEKGSYMSDVTYSFIVSSFKFEASFIDNDATHHCVIPWRYCIKRILLKVSFSFELSQIQK